VLPVLVGPPNFPLAVFTYQLVLAVAVALGWFLTVRWARTDLGLPPKHVLGMVALLTFAGIAGARIHFVLNNPAQFEDAPVRTLFFWQGGVHAVGGILGVIAGLLLVRRWSGTSAAALADVSAPVAALVLTVVRFGCLARGCCFGVVGHWPWSITYPRTSYVFLVHADRGLVIADAAHSAEVHPLPLYFAAVGLIIAVVARTYRQGKRYDGQIALLCLVLYAGATCILEFFRDDYPGRVYWGSLPQLTWAAFFLLTTSVVAWLLLGRIHRRPLSPALPRATMAQR
jgi:phosphatidylglycerol---prolipoprotein diacylglyceryl transferase